MQTPGVGAAGAMVDVAAWAEGALGTLSALPGVHRVGLALAEGGGRRLRFTASDRDVDGGLEWCFVDAYDDVPLNTAVRTGEPVVGSLDDLRARYRAFVDRQRGTATVGLAALPLVAAGQVLGGVVLFFERAPTFDHELRRHLAWLGEQVGTSLRCARRAAESPRVALSDEPVPLGASVAFHDVPPDAGAVADARRFLRRTLVDWGVDEAATDAAALCLSELVTNAVIHARTGCTVRILLEDGVLTTTVRDGGAREAPPDDVGDDPLQVHGRGLQLVEALAARWGSEVDTDGTTVWFVLDL